MQSSASSARLSDKELITAKQTFFDMDKDGSGNIDKHELQFKLHSLGQSPTEEEVQQLLSEAERASGGDNNGRIERREFLSWYGNTLRHKSDTSSEDVRHAFQAVAGGKSGMCKENLQQLLMQEYDLDVDVGTMFDLCAGQELALADFEKIVLGSPHLGSPQRRAAPTRAWQ